METNQKTNENLKQKQCSGCREVKPTTEFHKNKHRVDGLQSQCIDCNRETQRMSYLRKHNVDRYLRDVDRKHPMQLIFKGVGEPPVVSQKGLPRQVRRCSNPRCSRPYLTTSDNFSWGSTVCKRCERIDREIGASQTEVKKMGEDIEELKELVNTRVAHSPQPKNPKE